MASTVLKRIIRRPLLSLTGFLLAAVLCFVLCFLVQYRQEQEENIRQIRETYPILCTVTDARGVNTQSLRLYKRYLQWVEDEEEGIGSYIRDLKVTRELLVEGVVPGEDGLFSGESDTLYPGMGSSLSYRPDYVLCPFRKALGLSDPACSELTDPAKGGDYTSTVEDFFHRDENICLVPETEYEKLEGAVLSFRLRSPYTKDGSGGVGYEDFKVVGWYKGEGDSLLLPYPCAQRVGYEIADTISVDSISFFVKDNTKLEEMKKKAMEVFTEPAPSSYSGRAGLVVKDSVYRLTLRETEQNIKQINQLIPVSLILSLSAGLLAGYLAVRGETKTYALMRTLGVGKLRLFGMVLLEQLLLPAAGALAVGLVMKQPLPAFGYFGCHAAGCLLAGLRPVLAAPTKLLRAQE